MKTAWFVLLTLSIVLISFSCERAQRQPSLVSEQAISEVRVRQLATQYRDQWLAERTAEDTAQLARGAIKLVEKIESGWHVVYATPTGGGPGMEEGLHIYYLHVYLNSSGELDKVVLGPDVLS